MDKLKVEILVSRKSETKFLPINVLSKQVVDN